MCMLDSIFSEENPYPRQVEVSNLFLDVEISFCVIILSTVMYAPSPYKLDWNVRSTELQGYLKIDFGGGVPLGYSKYNS